MPGKLILVAVLALAVGFLGGFAYPRSCAWEPTTREPSTALSYLGASADGRVYLENENGAARQIRYSCR